MEYRSFDFVCSRYQRVTYEVNELRFSQSQSSWEPLVCQVVEQTTLTPLVLSLSRSLTDSSVSLGGTGEGTVNQKRYAVPTVSFS